MKTVLFAFSLFFISFGTLTAQTHQQPTGITVTGEGTIKVAPDQVKISARIETKGQSAQEVKASTDNVMAAVLKYLKKEDIDKKSYKTNYVRLDKKTDYSTKETYYSAEQAISITLHNVARYDEIMEGLMQAGINRIDGVSFEDSQLEKHRVEARQKAAQNAMAKAQTYAQTLGLKLGKAEMIREAGSSMPMPRNMLYSVQRAYKSADTEATQTTLAIGQIEITEKIEVRFGLNLE